MLVRSYRLLKPILLRMVGIFEKSGVMKTTVPKEILFILEDYQPKLDR